MRWAVTMALALGLPGLAHAACQQVPLPETPDAILRAFTARMAQVGATSWFLAPDGMTVRGQMYAANATEVRFFVKDGQGLAGEVSLLLSTFTPSDLTRLETAADFLASHLSGSPENVLHARVVRAIADTRRDHQVHAVLEGETVLVFSEPGANAVAVVAGHRRCD